MTDRAVLAPHRTGRSRLVIEIVVAAVLLTVACAACAAGLPDALFGGLQAAYPCGDADLGGAPRCTLADPGRAQLGLLLVLPVPALTTAAGIVAAVILLVVRRRAILPAAVACVLAVAAVVEGRAVLAVELHRIIHP